MFPKYSRIQKGDIVRIMKEGAAYHSPSFSLKVLKNEVKNPLFAVIVSKKVAKTAVSRNKNKRRVREVLRKEAENLPQDRFYIVMLKKDLNKSIFLDIHNELKELLSRVK